MVIDYKQFELALQEKTKADKLLHLLEQTPKRIISYDISQKLYEVFKIFNKRIHISLHLIDHFFLKRNTI